MIIVVLSLIIVDDMILKAQQYDLLSGYKNGSGRGIGVIPPKGYSNFHSALLWDEPVNEAKHRWGKCHPGNKCVGVPYTMNPKTPKHGAFTPKQKGKIHKAMEEIEQRTCIR